MPFIFYRDVLHCEASVPSRSILAVLQPHNSLLRVQLSSPLPEMPAYFQALYQISRNDGQKGVPRKIMFGSVLLCISSDKIAVKIKC